MKDFVQLSPINQFRGEYFFLSNFYEAPVEYGGITYQTNEAAFQAQKCAKEEDRKKFAALSPGDAKRMGRQVTLRPDWEDVKVNIMRDIVIEKFNQNPDLRDKLMDLEGAYLEEGNTWGDRVWGTVNGQGKNLLGQILMEVRDKFIEQVERYQEEILEDAYDNLK